MQNTTNNNIAKALAICGLEALYFDGGVSIAFGDYNLATPFLAGFTSLATRKIFNEYLPHSVNGNEFSYALSIVGGAIGGGLKYGYKGNNIIIGAYNNILYEAARMGNFDPTLSTYIIEISDQILSDYLAKPSRDFSLKKSIQTGFFVAFVLNGIGNQILSLSNEYIFEPIGKSIPDNYMLEAIGRFVSYEQNEL